MALPVRTSEPDIYRAERHRFKPRPTRFFYQYCLCCTVSVYSYSVHYFASHGTNLLRRVELRKKRLSIKGDIHFILKVKKIQY